MTNLARECQEWWPGSKQVAPAVINEVFSTKASAIVFEPIEFLRVLVMGLSAKRALPPNIG